MSRVGAYQAAATRCGTTIVRADPNLRPLHGGAVTKHPLTNDAANTLVKELRQLGADAKIADSGDDYASSVYVYLACSSFQRSDLLVGEIEAGAAS